MGVPAFGLAGSTAPVSTYGYVVKVHVGSNRACTGVAVSDQLVLTSRECFQVGSSPVVAGPPPV
ncbi:MAG TPA: trypsin-like serine protease, partial [Rugosimonospora sp.]|nr:trypsin-like serine protease [Rugosimonospora sp.]